MSVSTLAVAARSPEFHGASPKEQDYTSLMSDNLNPQETHTAVKSQTADASRFCPTCGSEMRELRCKLKCDTCGFFLSCSDFY